MLAIFLAIIVGGLSHAETYTAKACKLSFESTGEPVKVKIEGTSENECTGSATVEGGKVTKSEFKLKLDKIDTGIPLRNKHLRENFLHTEKFPEATLVITDMTDLDKHLAGTASGFSKFTAEMDLSGVKAPIEIGQYQIKNKKDVTVKFDLDFANHNIEKPSFMGVRVVDKVHITVKFEI